MTDSTPGPDYMVTVGIRQEVDVLDENQWACSVSFAKRKRFDHDQRPRILALVDLLRHLPATARHTPANILSNSGGYLFELAAHDPGIVTDLFDQAGLDWPGHSLPSVGDCAIQISIGRADLVI